MDINGRCLLQWHLHGLPYTALNMALQVMGQPADDASNARPIMASELGSMSGAGMARC